MRSVAVIFALLLAGLFLRDAKAQAAPERDAPALQITGVFTTPVTARPKPGWFVRRWTGACAQGDAAIQVGSSDKLGQPRTCEIPGSAAATVGVVFATCSAPAEVNGAKTACECNPPFQGTPDDCKLPASACAKKAELNGDETACVCNPPNVGTPDDCRIPPTACSGAAERNSEGTACVCNPPFEGTPDDCRFPVSSCALPAEPNNAKTACVCKFPHEGTPDNCRVPDAGCPVPTELNDAETACACNPPHEGTADDCRIPDAGCPFPTVANDAETACLCASPFEGTPGDCKLPASACVAPAELDDAETACVCNYPNKGTADNCVSPPPSNCPDLYDAAEKDDLHCARYWTAGGRDVNRFIGALNPLILAARHDAATVAQFLIDNGASVNAVDSDGNRESALHQAALHDSAEVAQVLVDNGASVNITSGVAERTPLHYAAQSATATLVAKVLIDGGADVNRGDRVGNTPLDLARTQRDILGRNTPLVNFLLLNGGFCSRSCGRLSQGAKGLRVPEPPPPQYPRRE